MEKIPNKSKNQKKIKKFIKKKPKTQKCQNCHKLQKSENVSKIPKISDFFFFLFFFFSPRKKCNSLFFQYQQDMIQPELSSPACFKFRGGSTNLTEENEQTDGRNPCVYYRIILQYCCTPTKNTHYFYTHRFL